MRRCLAICFLIVYVTGATELDQLLKFPLLVRHYLEHKKENPGTSIATFIQIHYLQPQPFDADYQEDMQLPFKQGDDHCLTISTILPAVPVSMMPALRQGYYVYNLFKTPDIPLLDKEKIFKPPRLG